MEAVIKNSGVLATVKQMLRLSNSDHNIYLTSLINEGVRRLSTGETLIVKNCTVESQNSRFYLPADCKQILAFRNSGSCIQGTFVDVNFFTQCGCNLGSSQAINPLSNLLDIQGRWAYFILSVPDGEQFEIAYQALNTDEDGLMIINEEAAIAVQNYASWMFAVSYPENYQRSQWEVWESNYMFQAAKCRGLAARRKFEQAREQIRGRVMQVVNSAAPISLLMGSYSSFFYPTITSI